MHFGDTLTYDVPRQYSNIQQEKLISKINKITWITLAVLIGLALLMQVTGQDGLSKIWPLLSSLQLTVELAKRLEGTLPLQVS